MSILLIILIVLAMGAAGWFISTFNFFKSTKVRIDAAVQEIGNQLKRQADLIPNLESSTKGYLKQERTIFKKLADARKQIASAVKSGDVQKMADAGSQLASLLPSVKVAVEDNPDIKSDKVVQKLMDELRDTADKVMYSRRLVIDLTADYNVKRETVPSSIVASIFNFKKMKGLITPEEGEHLEVGKDELKSPKVNLE